MEHSENMDRQLIDGVKVFEKGNSVLILPDKERAEFLVFAESDDEQQAQRLAEEYQSRIGDWQKE